MPVTHDANEYYLCSDGPESHGDLIATVMPRLEGVCNRARSMTWGIIAYSISRLNMPFGVALEHMRGGQPARIVSMPDEHGNSESTHWIILQNFKPKGCEWEYKFKILEELEPDEALDMKNHYLIRGVWYKPTDAVVMDNSWIVSFCWELAYRENSNADLATQV